MKSPWSCENEEIEIDSLPPMMKGKFSKRGHFRKNWKSRYFVLELGRLSYYEKEGRNGEGVGYLKSMVLRNAGISHHDDPAMIVIVDKLNRTDLFIKAESVSMAEDWRKGLVKHMRYAIVYPNASLQRDQDEDGFRRSIADALVSGEILSRVEAQDNDTEEKEKEDRADKEGGVERDVDQRLRFDSSREISMSVLEQESEMGSEEGGSSAGGSSIEGGSSVSESKAREKAREKARGDKDRGIAQVKKVNDAGLTAIGKQLKQLEAESKRVQEEAAKEWQRDTAPGLKEAVKALDKRMEGLRKEHKAFLKKKTGQQSNFEEEIVALAAEQDELKLQLFFPLRPSVCFGSGGVYVSMDHVWLQNLAGRFRLRLASASYGSQIEFSLLGAEGAGVEVDITIGGFKLKSEQKGIPSLTLDSLHFKVSLRVEFLLSFFTATRQWTAAPDQFVVQLLSFKGPFGISRSMVSALLSIAVPVIKSSVLEMLPLELGVMLSEALVPLELEGSFQLDRGVVVQELFSDMQKSPTVCRKLGYNEEQVLNFLVLQKSMDRKPLLKSVVDLLRYRNDHCRQQMQWEGIVRLWDQAALQLFQVRERTPGLVRESEVRNTMMSEANFYPDDDEDEEGGMSSLGSSFLSLEKLLRGVARVQKNRLSIRFSLDTFRLDVNLGLLLRHATGYYSRVAREQEEAEQGGGGGEAMQAARVYVQKMLELCSDARGQVASFRRVVHNLQLLLRMHVTSGSSGEVTMLAKDVYTQFPISFITSMEADADSTFSPIVPTMQNIRTKENGFISAKLFHLGSEEMLKKARFLAFKSKPRLDSMLASLACPASPLPDSDSCKNSECSGMEMQRKELADYMVHCNKERLRTEKLLAVRPEKMSAVKIASCNVIRPRMSFIVSDLVTLQPGTALFIVQVGAEEGAEKVKEKDLEGRGGRRSTMLGDEAGAVLPSFHDESIPPARENGNGEEQAGAPISMQGTHGLRTEAHIPEIQFLGVVPALLQFVGSHFDDLDTLAAFFDESEEQARARADFMRLVLDIAGKYMLTPRFELLVNVGLLAASLPGGTEDEVSVVISSSRSGRGQALNLFLRVDVQDLMEDWEVLMKAMVDS